MTSAGRLTAGQRRLIDEICADWESRTARPDRRDAERALGELHDRWGLERPKTVIWFDSPLAGAIAARTLLDGDFLTLERPEPSSFEEDAPFASRWRMPRVPSAYRSGHDPAEPDLRAVLTRVGEPAWAVNGAAATWFRDECLAPADPARFAAIGAEAHGRLLEGLEPVFPPDRWQEVSAALRSRADAPHSGGWKRWRDVWSTARAPQNHALLILSVLRGEEDESPRTRLRLAPAVGWWWSLGDVALLTPPPAEVHTDELGRLHREDGPAVRHRDGSAQYCWRGQVVPPDLVESGWSAADIAYAPDEELQRRAARSLGTESYAARLPAEHVVPDLRRCALERLGWRRFAVEAPLPRVARPVADPGDPGCELTLYDVPPGLFGRPARVVVRAGGARDGDALTVPADATEPLAAASWLGDGSAEPAPEPELLTRIRRSEHLRDMLAGLDFDFSDEAEHVEEIHLAGGARLRPIGSHGTGGTYFLCGDGPRRPVLYVNSEGGYQVLGRDLGEALRFMVSADPDGGDPEEEDAEAAQALGLRPLSAEEYRAHRDDAEAMAAALVPVMSEEGNAYRHERSTWFR